MALECIRSHCTRLCEVQVMTRTNTPTLLTIESQRQLLTNNSAVPSLDTLDCSSLPWCVQGIYLSTCVCKPAGYRPVQTSWLCKGPPLLHNSELRSLFLGTKIWLTRQVHIYMHVSWHRAIIT